MLRVTCRFGDARACPYNSRTGLSQNRCALAALVLPFVLALLLAVDVGLSLYLDRVHEV